MMNTTKYNIITTLFERKIILENNEDGQYVYSYTPLEIVEGTEYDFDGIKLFRAKKINCIIDEDYFNKEVNRYEFPFIDDTSSLQDQYVYGFSVITDTISTDNKKDIKLQMLKTMKKLSDYPLFHLVDMKDNFSKVFIMVDKFGYSIDAENFYELLDMLEKELQDIEKRKELEIIRTQNGEESKLKNEDNKKSNTPEIIVPNNILYSDVIYNKVSQTVICQDDQIKEIATLLAKNSRINGPALKSNILVCGPTGVGKTEIFRTISSEFDIPIQIEDSNEYTAASYKGKDVSEMLVHLLDTAHGDIQKAERGILVIDEIDKKVSQNKEHETYTSAVIKSLLTMAEGQIYVLNIPGYGEIPFDTSNLTFAFLGAFSGIEEYSEKRKNLGFMSKQDIEESVDINNIYNDDTLTKYGLLPEFLGRTSIVTMNNLGIDDFIRIIKTSNKSQLLLYKQLFESNGIKFTYDEKTIEAIAKKAANIGLGARSIKKIVEKSLQVANYQVFSNNPYKELIISEETIEDNKKFILK